MSPEDAAAIERRARELWDAQEQGFPKFTRMKWEDGSEPARQIIYQKAASELHWQGRIGTPPPWIAPETTKAADQPPKG